MTYWYELYGIRLRSDVELCFAQTVPSGEPDVDLLCASEGFFHRARREAVMRPGADKWYEFALLDDEKIYLRWEGLFEFVVDQTGRRIWFGSLGANSAESLGVYMLGRALSFALVKQGFEPIHSTTVVLRDKAVAFLGKSGFGKSSLAASFLADGYQLLTDDLLLVSGPSECLEAQPGPPRIKVFPWVARRCLGLTGTGVPMNKWSEKIVVALGERHHQNRRVRLGAFYVLEGPREVFRRQRIQISAFSRRDAFLELIRHTFNCDLTDSKRLQQLFSVSYRLASQVPVKRISYPRDLALLAEVRKSIVNDFYNCMLENGDSCSIPT